MVSGPDVLLAKSAAVSDEVRRDQFIKALPVLTVDRINELAHQFFIFVHGVAKREG